MTKMKKKWVVAGRDDCENNQDLSCRSSQAYFVGNSSEEVSEL